MSGALSDVLHQYKLFHVIIHWGRITLNTVLKWSLEYQNKNETDLYDMVIKNNCKKSFHKDQIKLLKDGVPIDSLDITIAFLLLLHIGCLSKPDDPAWKTSHSLECNLKMVKFHRNNSCHPSDSMTEKITVNKINELRKLYEDILAVAGNRFNIEEDEVKEKIIEITNGVDIIHEKIRETFDPTNDQHVQNFRKEQQILQNEINRQVIQEAQSKLQEVNSKSCLLQLVPWTPQNYHVKPSELYIPDEYQQIINSKTVQGSIIDSILDSKINDINAQQFWIVSGERGSGKTMLCKHLIEESSNQNSSPRTTKYSFILYSQEVDYKYDSLDAMVENIFHEIYTNNGLSFGHFMKILRSVPILVVIDGYTESHIKLVRDIVIRSNISVMVTVRPGSKYEIKDLIMDKANIIDVNIQMLKIENIEKIIANVLTFVGDSNQINALTVKIKEEMEKLGTWLKYPLGVIIMTLLWIHKEVDATTNTCIIQDQFFKHMANRFKDGVYKFNLCITMDKVNEKCKDIIEKFKDIFKKSGDYEVSKQEMEMLKKMCKENSLPEEYTLSSFFDSKTEIHGLEVRKIRTLPCILTDNVKEEDSVKQVNAQSTSLPDGTIPIRITKDNTEIAEFPVGGAIGTLFNNLNINLKTKDKEKRKKPWHIFDISLNPN